MKTGAATHLLLNKCADMPIKRIPLSCTVNTRDLGGFATNDGRVTKFKRLFRSDVPVKFSTEDMALLKELDIKSAIDLRAKDELERVPSAFEFTSDFKYFHCPFSVGNRSPVSMEDVPVLYGEIISDYSAMRQIMKIFIQQKGGIFFHCAAGKDRTGVVSALLLLIANVNISDILADYQVSYTYIRFIIRELLQKYPERSPFFGRSDMECMETTIQNFLVHFGDVQTYLSEIGLTSDEISILKEKLF